uniref:Furcatin hydrolase n=1 Tax=Viburnum furcatum TaxID=237940 RepID=FURH_VIBFR|nr:RecName: Full=Furcatin hydrolase; Short=FH; Flags: Precursor [Viburnum furcatum]BAD14925.1 furcatin hydrolase [Viburnum furcatum]
MATITTLASSVPLFRPYSFPGGSSRKPKKDNLSIKPPATSSLKVNAKLASADDTSSNFNKDNWLASADELSRSFPPGFLFGGGSASYQYEGAVKEGGRTPSIWDTFAHEFPDKIADGSNGDVAVDFYHRYKDDVKLMKKIGVNGFRFSISWTRILPSGKLCGGVNKEGVAFYNSLINELLANGIEPFVTIFHWDLPQGLENEYDGFLSGQIVNDYRDYAEVCFQEFGDRVKFWTTLNEPWTFCYNGYVNGSFAPGRCSTCTAGNSGTEPYLVAHNLLLSHAAVAQLYKNKYQASQKGQIGIVLVCFWMVPYSDCPYDCEAAQRALDFMLGWFLHPLTYGDYPESMRHLVGERLPQFTEMQAMMMKGSIDFLGLNYYTSIYAANNESPNPHDISYTTDSRVNLFQKRDGILIGPATGTPAFCFCPEGIRDLLVYTKEKYNNPIIYITECGLAEANINTVDQGVKDVERVEFYYEHLKFLRSAIKKGVNVKGFFTWSLLDDWEWNSGFNVRFGIVYIDHEDGLKRYLKYSALWFKKLFGK